MAHDVFVSYSTPDREYAFELIEQIEARGIGAWIAPRDVSPSADWAAEIVDAIAAARVMVLVFSAHSNDSPQVRREVERAAHRQLAILPFRVADVLPSKSLEYFLSSQHWLDAFPSPTRTHYDQLTAALEAIIRKRNATVPATPEAAPLSSTGQFAQLATGRHRQLPDEAPSKGFDPAQLAQLEQALASHVGPVARLLVRRASALARDLDTLKQSLSQEIAAETARKRFLVEVQSLR